MEQGSQGKAGQPGARAAGGEFEFLRGLPFGPYLPVTSPIHELDPRTRIMILLLLVTAFTASRSLIGMTAGLLIVLVVWRVAHVPFESLLRGWRSAAPFLIILAVLQVVLRTGGQDQPPLFTIGPLAASAADVWMGAALLLRFAALMAVLGLGASTIAESDLTHGLEALLRPLRLLRLPVYDFVTAIQVTLRFFPLLAQSAERIAKAQASRGGNWQPAGWNIIQRARQIAPLIVPLFVVSLRRAENMALAMDTRGYGSQPKRTSMVQLRYGWNDAVGYVLLIGLCLLIFLA
jgi:energy-coupling factor transport system permease protein